MKLLTMTRRIPLPTGKIGVTLNGSPPMVTDIQNDSPMLGKLRIGDVLDGVSVPNRFEVHHVEDSHILTEVLEKTSHLHRQLHVITDDDSPNTTDTETEFFVTIPPGKLGLTFEGDQQPTISKVWEYCPVIDFVQEGMWLKSILIPGEPELFCSHLSARDAYDCLRARARCEGRVLVLTNPPVAIAEPVSSPVSAVPHNTPATRYSAAIADSMSVSSEPVSTSGTASASASIDATIEGSVVTIKLHPGQRLRADHDTMIYMMDGFRVKTHAMNVNQFAKGYPLGMTDFIYEGSERRGTVAFGYGDKAISLNVEEYGGRIICQSECYLCSETSVKLYVESVPSNGGCILIKMVGNGHVWLTVSGPVITKTLQRGETMRCVTGAVMAFEKTVQYSTHRIRGGFKKSISGKGDCLWSELTGPGTVWLQGSVSDNAAPSRNADRQRSRPPTVRSTQVEI